MSEAIGSSSNSVGIATIDTNTSKTLGLSIMLAIDTHSIGSNIAIARNRVVVSIHTRSTLQSNSIAIAKLGLNFSTSNSYKGRQHNLENSQNLSVG